MDYKKGRLSLSLEREKKLAEPVFVLKLYWVGGTCECNCRRQTIIVFIFSILKSFNKTFRTEVFGGVPSRSCRTLTQLWDPKKYIILYLLQLWSKCLIFGNADCFFFRKRVLLARRKFVIVAFRYVAVDSLKGKYVCSATFRSSDF